MLELVLATGLFLVAQLIRVVRFYVILADHKVNLLQLAVIICGINAIGFTLPIFSKEILVLIGLPLLLGVDFLRAFIGLVYLRILDVIFALFTISLFHFNSQPILSYFLLIVFVAGGLFLAATPGMVMTFNAYLNKYVHTEKALSLIKFNFKIIRSWEKQGLNKVPNNLMFLLLTVSAWLVESISFYVLASLNNITQGQPLELLAGHLAGILLMDLGGQIDISSLRVALFGFALVLTLIYLMRTYGFSSSRRFN